MTNILSIPLERVLDDIEMIPGRWRRGASRDKLMYMVIHSMQAPETDGRAHSTAGYFKTTDRKALTHFTTDWNDVVRCAWDNEGVYGAAGTNWNGLHFEIPGYAEQSREEWTDQYGMATFQQVGRLMAAINLRHGIPLSYVGTDGLRSKTSGVVTHWDCSKVYEPGGHWDPGYHFPMEVLLEIAQQHRSGNVQEEDMALSNFDACTRESDGRTLAVFTFGDEILIKFDHPGGRSWWDNNFALMSAYVGRKAPETVTNPHIETSNNQFTIHAFGTKTNNHYIWRQTGGGAPDQWSGPFGPIKA